MTPLRISALGDSLTEGIGDPVPGGWRGWAALLADSLTTAPEGSDGPESVSFVNHATSGAQTADVLRRQLPEARARRPHLAAVLVGVNDTLRATYDIHAVARHLDTVFGSLVEDGTVLLTACLPDPGRMLGLPTALARPLGRRMASVNTVVHALSDRYEAVHVHAADHDWIHDPAMWSVDRLHPSESGHRALARAFHHELAERGVPVGPAPDLDTDGIAPSRAAQILWMATKGTRWVLDRCTDLLPDLLRLAAAERRDSRGGDLLDHQATEQTTAALRALPCPMVSPTSHPTARQLAAAQPVTAQPVILQAVTAPPVTLQAVTAQPVTLQPVTLQPSVAARTQSTVGRCSWSSAHVSPSSALP